MSEAEKLQKIVHLMLEKEKAEGQVAAINRRMAEGLGIASTTQRKPPNKTFSSNQFRAACRGAQ